MEGTAIDNIKLRLPLTNDNEIHDIVCRTMETSKIAANWKEKFFGLWWSFDIGNSD